MFGFIILVPPRWEGMAPVGDAGVTLNTWLRLIPGLGEPGQSTTQPWFLPAWGWGLATAGGSQPMGGLIWATPGEGNAFFVLFSFFWSGFGQLGFENRLNERKSIC